MTSRERIEIKDCCNRFSDRWPEHYHDLYNKISDYSLFQAEVLWTWIRWTKPPAEEARVIWEYIVRLREEAGSDIPVCKTKVEIVEIAREL